MKRILVLGCGMVGSAIAADLSRNFNVTAVDISETRVKELSGKYNINAKVLDIADRDKLSAQIKNCDIVVSAVPGFMGYRTLQEIISNRKDVVDISFFPEDPFLLDKAAKDNNVTAVVDCGVAPGLSNIILGYHYKKEKVNSFSCYVGGLPFEREYPYQYKAPFSPSDVIEEYTRPARLKENNHIVIKPALSEPELLNFPGIGTLEAFNSDGLRSLLNLDIPDMREKTLRYPGHLDAVKLLRDSGFFSPVEIDINGVQVKPVDLTSKLLFKLWQLNEHDDEFTVMQVNIETKRNTYSYSLFDRRNKDSGFSSMARTTGYTCTAVVNLLADGRIKQKGIFPPELIGMDENNSRFILEYLQEREVVVKFQEKVV